MKVLRYRFSPTITKMIKALIAVGLLGWLVSSGRLNIIHFLSMQTMNMYLFILIASMVSNILVQSVRWWVLLRAQDINVSCLQAIELSWIGQFFSMVAPGAAGGDLARAYYISREAPEAKISSVSTVVVDRALGLYSLLLYSILPLFLLLLRDDMSSTILQIGGVIVVLIIGMNVSTLVIWHKSTRKLALIVLPERFRLSINAIIDSYVVHWRTLIVCFGLSMLSGILLLLAFILASDSIGIVLNWQIAFLVVPLVIVANSIPLSPGGIGVGETTASLLFAQFGVVSGAEIMLTIRLWFFLLRCPGGLIYILHKRGYTASQIDYKSYWHRGNVHK